MLVLRESNFGHWWCVRIVVLITLGVVWSSSRRPSTSDSWQRLFFRARACRHLPRHACLRRPRYCSGQGASRVRIWLAMRCTHWPPARGSVHCQRWSSCWAAVNPTPFWCETKVFSVLGITSVSVLLATGMVNAWFLVGSLPRWDTPYGYCGAKACRVCRHAIHRGGQSMDSDATPVEQRLHREHASPPQCRAGDLRRPRLWSSWCARDNGSRSSSIANADAPYALIPRKPRRSTRTARHQCGS